MSTPWQLLIANSTLTTGTALEHINAQTKAQVYQGVSVIETIAPEVISTEIIPEIITIITLPEIITTTPIAEIIETLIPWPISP